MMTNNETPCDCPICRAAADMFRREAAAVAANAAAFGTRRYLSSVGVEVDRLHPDDVRLCRGMLTEEVEQVQGDLEQSMKAANAVGLPEIAAGIFEFAYLTAGARAGRRFAEGATS